VLAVRRAQVLRQRRRPILRGRRVSPENSQHLVGDEDGLQPADTPAELTGPVWVVDDDDVRESLTFALGGVKCSPC